MTSRIAELTRAFVEADSAHAIAEARARATEAAAERISARQRRFRAETADVT